MGITLFCRAEMQAGGGAGRGTGEGGTSGYSACRSGSRVALERRSDSVPGPIRNAFLSAGCVSFGSQKLEGGDLQNLPLCTLCFAADVKVCSFARADRAHDGLKTRGRFADRATGSAPGPAAAQSAAPPRAAAPLPGCSRCRVPLEGGAAATGLCGVPCPPTFWEVPVLSGEVQVSGSATAAHDRDGAEHGH